MQTLNLKGYILEDEKFGLGDILKSTEQRRVVGDPLNTQAPDNDVELLETRTGPAGDILQQVFNDAYPDLQVTRVVAEKIARNFNSLRRGSAAGVRLICTAGECDFSGACELYNTKVGPVVQGKDPKTGLITYTETTLAPEGKPCPLEEVVVTDTRNKYVEAFQDTDASPIVLETYVNDLCHIAAMEWRCSMVLAFDSASPVQVVPGAVTGDGHVIYKTESNPVLEQLERLRVQKNKILTEGVLSPREKYKKEHAVGKTGDDSLSRSNSARRARLKEAQGQSLPELMEMPDHVKDADVKGKGSIVPLAPKEEGSDDQ